MEETGGKPGRGKRCEKRAAMTGSLRETGASHLVHLLRHRRACLRHPRLTQHAQSEEQSSGQR